MAITRTAMVDDDGSGTTGTIINAAWKTELYNQIDAADAAIVPPATPTPTWITVPHNPAFYSASAGAWTVEAGDQINLSYVMLNPATMFLSFDLRATALSVAAQFLYLSLPGGKTIRGSTMTALAASVGATLYPASAYAAPGQGMLYLLLPSLGVWPVAAGTLTVMGTAILDVVAPGMDAPSAQDPNLTDPHWQPVV
jgi:hypothetical protein